MAFGIDVWALTFSKHLVNMSHYTVLTKYRFLSDIDDHICDVIVENDFDPTITIKVSSTYWNRVYTTLTNANIPVTNELYFDRKILIHFTDVTEVHRLLNVLDTIK